jgi:hypothetical protein
MKNLFWDDFWDKIKLKSKEKDTFLDLKIPEGRGKYYFKKQSAHMYIYAILHYIITFLLW